MLKTVGIWPAAVIVFVSNACIMIVELVAGRILAPYIGVSLYTWTSIIGVVLAGMTLGYFLGGQFADRYASRTHLGLLLFLGALSCLGILVATNLATAASSSVALPLIPKVVALTAVIFFLPSFLLAAISPMVVKLTLQDLAETGRVVGRLNAAGALGSITGTFLTGFVLVSWLGTRTILWLVAIVLILMGLIFGAMWRTGAQRGVALIVLAAYALLFLNRDYYRAPCYKETNYYCIQVFDLTVEGYNVRAMALDHLIHSYNSVEDPTILAYGYVRVYAEITAYLAKQRPQLKALFIGGGGYTFPRAMEVVYPQSVLEVIEIDPGVTQMAYEQMGLSPSTRIVSYNQDGRLVLMNFKDGAQYDIIFGDAFNDLSIPYHLTTYEFHEMVKRLLKPDGVYAANIIDNFPQGQFLRAYINTLRQSFPFVYLLAEGPAWELNAPSTFVAVASPQRLDLERFKAFISQDGTKEPFSAILDEERLLEYLQQGRRIIFTDDYAPVDNLIAPLFVQRGY